MSTAAEPAEQKVGRLLLRAATTEEGSDYRRSPMTPILELRCLPTGTGPIRSGVAVALAAVLATGLLVFAIIVRSWPAIGSVSVAVAALGWLVVASRGGASAAVVRVTGAELSVEAAGAKQRFPIADVESVATGEDRDAHRTVWARVKGEGRVLLLDALTPDEAEVARERIAAAVARRAP